MKINIKDIGTMTVKLDPTNAPITVAHITELAKNGFYNGLIFHRVISGFMIQGGDPTGTGFGDPSQKKIKGEFLKNGVQNRISHKRGVISMARAGYSYDSASSQFFICHADCPFLDGDYAAFGELTDGFDVLDKIAAAKTDMRDKPCDRDYVIESIELEAGE